MSTHRAQRAVGWRALVEQESERERDELRASSHGGPETAPAVERTGDDAVVAVGAIAPAPSSAGDGRAELARWEDEGGPVDPRPPVRPVNAVVRDLVRACLIPRVVVPSGLLP
ncbi:hypothetical protein J421_6145 (plasmid) [Gemmatirosa kalamazoonensis]|jgi:hypothetical protein|uniref:Uncharacterized protein n=1 Tax=Gemmatirosa kalamazoonensis TaxID=861299 RepID=W0RTS2_9BACT|nr:hypothetical protein [Gemmatirosa kalamazoonensis]AHG93680.1 hypothetical protein J421_6145 [Gemmatirosa kalamazoonensis]